MKQEPIRVLCVFANLDRGGAESMCMNIYRKIDRTKVQFDFVKHTPNKGAFEEEIVSLGGKIYQAPRYNLGNYMSYQRWWLDHFNNHPEHIIVHGHFFTISSVYFKAARKAKRVTVGHAHSSHVGKSSIKELIKAQMLKKVESKSDYCLACSEKAGRWLFPKKKFIVLKNAIDLNDFKLNCSCNKQIGNLVVGTVGSFTGVKNPMQTINIFNEIHKRNPDSRFLWVGDGPMRNEIENRIDSYGLTNSMSLLGVRNDVYQVLQEMDAFIMPSHFEGLPVTLIEAQASGLKCFVSDKITQEADVTGRVEFLPIDNYLIWADRILASDLTKKDTQQEIRLAGYDINDTASWIEAFYCNIIREYGDKQNA